MHSLLRCLAAASILLSAAGCTTPPESLQNMADRNYMRYAVGKPYADVATLNPTALMGGESAYGPPIGSYLLAGGDMVHRHMGESGSSTTDVDLASLVGTSRSAVNYRLAYFRVGPDGVVRDWAVGSVPGGQTDCVRYIGGIIEKCTDQNLLRRSFAVYDSLVRTSAGEPLSSWGQPVETAPPATAGGENAD